MVQVLKKELKEILTKTAREEFLENGFGKASMRNIAKKSNVSLSNIYNYFKNKDALFEEVVFPTIKQIEALKTKLKSQKDSNYIKFDKSEAYFEQIVDFLETNKENLKLIAFYSHGSRLENYVSDWIEFYGKFEYKTLKEKAKSHKEIMKSLPSEFFLINLSGFFFKAVLELTNKDLNRKKLEKYVDEVFAFVYQGWDYYTDF